MILYLMKYISWYDNYDLDSYIFEVSEDGNSFLKDYLSNRRHE